tara:strand:- start:44 stop:331 length:288 start_codon:yes stop_codon:yes gene_type:complete
LQSALHPIRSQARPVNPAWQAHVPVARSHAPTFEHSVVPECTVSGDVATANQGIPSGQERNEQSAAVKPVKQVQVVSILHAPWEEHEFGHDDAIV